MSEFIEGQPGDPGADGLSTTPPNSNPLRTTPTPGQAGGAAAALSRAYGGAQPGEPSSFVLRGGGGGRGGDGGSDTNYNGPGEDAATGGAGAATSIRILSAQYTGAVATATGVGVRAEASAGTGGGGGWGGNSSLDPGQAGPGGQAGAALLEMQDTVFSVQSDGAEDSILISLEANGGRGGGAGATGFFLNGTPFDPADEAPSAPGASGVLRLSNTQITGSEDREVILIAAIATGGQGGNKVRFSGQPMPVSPLAGVGGDASVEVRGLDIDAGAGSDEVSVQIAAAYGERGDYDFANPEPNPRGAGVSRLVFTDANIRLGEGDDLMTLTLDQARDFTFSNVTLDGGATPGEFNRLRVRGQKGVNNVEVGNTFVLDLSTVQILNFFRVEYDGFSKVTGIRGNANQVGANAPVEFVGMDTNDTLRGAALNDILRGGGGADVLEGKLGDDLLDGGDGIDTVTYATRNNFGSFDVGVRASLLTGVATGPEGTDTLIGIENLTGSMFGDVLTGDGGANLLDGGFGDDALNGDAGADTLIGGYGADVLNGGAGADVLSGNQDDDTLNGNADNDTLYGGAGNDIAYGGQGDDVVYGNLGDDTLYGNLGADVFYGGVGVNRLDGGDGIDTASYADAAAGVTVSLLSAGAAQSTGVSSDTLIAIENLTGSNFADTLTGDGAANALSGGAGADTLLGGFGADLLSGNADNDTLSGNQDNDILYGGAGDDILYGGAGDDVLVGGLGVDTLFGNLGADIFRFAAATDSTLAAFDTINGFESGADKIDLRPFYRVGVDDYSLITTAGVTTVTVDAGSNGTTDFKVVIVGTAVAADILFG